MKLQSEADVHLGPGGSTNTKKGSLDVYRGGERSLCVILAVSLHLSCIEGYQFGYFLRKAEPHSVILKVDFEIFS